MEREGTECEQFACGRTEEEVLTELDALRKCLEECCEESDLVCQEECGTPVWVKDCVRDVQYVMKALDCGVIEALAVLRPNR